MKTRRLTTKLSALTLGLLVLTTFCFDRRMLQVGAKEREPSPSSADPQVNALRRLQSFQMKLTSRGF